MMKDTVNKINNLASKEVSPWLEDAKIRQQNIEWTRRSFKIAVRILREIRAQKPVNGMTQKKLAEAMGVTPQYINKVVKGKENLTLETISKIEAVLGITLMEVPGFEAAGTYVYESKEAKITLNSFHSKSIGEETSPYRIYDFKKGTGSYG